MAINVRINQPSQVRVKGTTTFVGSSAILTQLEEVSNIANTALIVAQNASDTANTKYDKTGGHVYGDVFIDNNLTVSNTIFATSEIIDAGSF